MTITIHTLTQTHTHTNSLNRRTHIYSLKHTHTQTHGIGYLREDFTIDTFIDLTKLKSHCADRGRIHVFQTKMSDKSRIRVNVHCNDTSSG